MRINLFIAKSGYASRRGADCLIEEGKVEVNGRKIFEPFLKVSNKDEVKVNGELLNLKEHIYIVFNKPKGVTTTLSDKFALKKVIDFFPKEFQGIYPVGRLDKQSCGLLIFTNDGDFCYQLTHPKFLVEKEYLVELKGNLALSDCRRAKIGIKMKGERLKVKSIKVLNKNKELTLCKAVVTEGKNRHLRRLFGGLGFPVQEIIRVRIGKLTLGDLPIGKYKKIAKNKMYSFFKK